MKQTPPLKNVRLHKAILLLLLIFSIPALAQTKWEASGNNAVNTDFIGTNNNVDFIIKTNGNTAAKIKADGSFLLKSLESHGTGIATFDNDGKLLGLSFNGDHNKVLSGDGTWSTISDLSIQGLKFDNTSGISFSKTNGIRTFAYGKRGGTPVYRSYCAAPAASTTNHLFGGMIQIYNADSTGNIVPGSGLLNFQTFPGTSSIDASIEGTTAGGGLLLNYFCGNNTFINTGSNGGDVMITSPTLGKVGIGITPTEKLDVAGNIKLNSNTLYLKNDVYHGLKYTTSFGGTTMDGPVLFGYSNGTLGTTGGGEKIALFWNDNGKVGIGNTNPQAQLDVTGDIRVSSLSGSGTNVIQVDNNGRFSLMPLSMAGVGFWQTTDGGNTIFHNTGKVGIGNNAPADLLQVGDGSNRLVAGIASSAELSYGTSYLGFNAARNEGTWNINADGAHNGGSVIFSNILGDILFSTIQTNAATTQTKTDEEILAGTKLFIAADGNVAIGTIHTDGFKFSVNGNMRAKDIIVKLTGWSDFVFDEDYIRMSILDKEAYYKKEKHLPNINQGHEIVENGLQVGTTMNGMMQNIEENTLDLADLYKKFLTLERENAELKQRVIQLEKTQ